MEHGQRVAELYEEIELKKLALKKATNESAFIQEELGDTQFMYM